MLRVLVDAMRRRLSRLCRCRSSKLRAFLVLSFLATAACVGISVGVAYKYLGNVEQHDLPLQGDSLQKVNMSITISTVDAENLSLLVAWYPSAVNCPQPPTLINFFFDEMALTPIIKDNKVDIPSNMREGAKPTFQFNSTCGQDLKNGTYFATETILYGGIDDQVSSPLLVYPFDTYFARITTWARLNATNEPVGIIAAPPTGNPLNFNVDVISTFTENTPEALIISLALTRSPAVKVLACVIVIINWAITVTFLLYTIAGIVWQEDVVKEVFIVPIATLFAFPAVRSNLPGAPEGFGAFMDFIGILPNLAIIALCSATLLCVVLAKRIHWNVKNEKRAENQRDPDREEERSLRQHEETSKREREDESTRKSSSRVMNLDLEGQQTL